MASVKAAYMGGMPPGENIEKPVEVRINLQKPFKI